MSLKRYRVTFYYNATGIEGAADERCYGEYVAATVDDAIEQAIQAKAPYFSAPDQEFLRGCLSAEQVETN